MNRLQITSVFVHSPPRFRETKVFGQIHFDCIKVVKGLVLVEFVQLLLVP